MFFGIKGKLIILPHTMCCWLLPQMYQCDMWLGLWPRVTFIETNLQKLLFI